MKQLLKHFLSVLCAGLMLINGITAYAEEDDSVMLPSGKYVKALQYMLENDTNWNGDRDYASASVGLFQGDEILYTGYFGETDMENHIPADENSVYEWGSISKTFIWVSAMQLWEQGKLDLEKDVREYLPEGFFQHLTYDEPITMLNLMNHNAGWQETIRPIWKTEENQIPSLKDALQEIEPTQVHRPNEVTAYSNYGAGVAGYVIECVSGMDYCEYVHKNILEPLKMEHTAVNAAHSDNQFVYEQRKKMKSYHFVMGNMIDLGTCLNYVPIYPAGAVTGTLSDLMTYAQALVNEDAPLFQNPETQKILFTGTDFYGESDIPLCCHGFWCTEYGVRTYGHDGGTTFGQASMIFDLESKTGLVVMVNEPNGNWYLRYPSIETFGLLSSDKYVSNTSQETSLKDYYLNSRSFHEGMMKFFSYVTAISFKEDEFKDIGNHVYQYTETISELNQESSVLYGLKITPDGNANIQVPSIEAIQDRFYLVKLFLFAFYLLTAIISFYVLRIRYKLKKAGNYKNFKYSKIFHIGWLAEIISVLAMISSFVAYAKGNGGFSFTAGMIIGIIQMLCIAVCGVSAITSAISLSSKKPENLKPYYTALNLIGTIFTISAIIYFEMYCFWK